MRVTSGVLKARRVGIIALVIAVSLAGIGYAWAADPRDRLPGVEENLQQAKEELSHSTQKLASATDAYQSAAAKLPGAEAKLSKAQTELQSAQSQFAAAQQQVRKARKADQAAAKKLKKAEQRLAKQKKKINKVNERIVDKRATVSDVASRAYQRGAGGALITLASAVKADTLHEFISGARATQSVMGAENSVLNDMKNNRAELSNDRVVFEDLRAEADRLRQQAADRLDETRQREQQAQAAKESAAHARQVAAAAKTQVDNLISAKQHAMKDAETAKAEDERQTKEWASERAKLQAEIEEIERQERERRERERLERERQERERKERERLEREQQESKPADPAPPAPEPAPAPPPPPEEPSSGFRFPVASPYVTSPFGMRVHPVTGIYKLHDGTDFRAYCGTPIRSSAAGSVSWAEYRGAYGNQVAVNHSGEVTTYSHLSRFAVSPGESVGQGEVIGYSGSTGYSTACHLHFMVYVNGNLTDPMSLL